MTAEATTAAEDEEVPTRPERSVQNEVGHTMEAPESEEEEMREEEESEEPSSSVAPRRRGTEAEREAMMENDIFRPSLSDMVAENLVNFGLRPQQMIENNEANSGRGWFVLGSIQAMLPWGEDGIRDYYASRGLGDVYKRPVFIPREMRKWPLEFTYL